MGYNIYANANYLQLHGRLIDEAENYIYCYNYNDGFSPKLMQLKKHGTARWLSLIHICGAQHALELFRVWLLGHLFQDGGGFFQDFPGKLSRGGKTAEQEDQNQRQTQYSLHPFHFLSRVDTLLGQPFPEYTWEGKGAQACPVCTFLSCPRVWAGVF